jgi:hypothetical protein
MEADFNGTEFEKIRAAEPPDARLEEIRNRIIGSLRPVRPLPSDRVLVTTLTAGFICLGVLCAIPIGLKGYHAMRTAQKLADYAVILFCALILALVLTGEIIPGSRKRLSPALAPVALFAMMIAVTTLLFPDYSTAQFIRRGIPCLAIGTVCEIAAAVLVWRVVCLGMLTDRLAGILTATMLSGMLGVFVLALHCPILNAAHILSWHLTVPALGLAGGTLLANRIERRIISGSRESV